MDQLLDFSKDIDIDLLDRIVSVFFSGTSGSAERSEADNVLKQFQDHPDSWTRAPKILQESKNPQSKCKFQPVLMSSNNCTNKPLVRYRFLYSRQSYFHQVENSS